MRKTQGILRSAAALAAVLLAAGLAAPAGAASKGALTRTDTRAAVTVRVAFLNPLGGVKGDALEFEVSMDTHSVDLSAFRVEKLAVLRRAGGADVAPLGWFRPGGGGHHRSGVLRFPARDASGEPLLPPGKGVLELRIRGVASPEERLFRWGLPAR